MAREIEVKSVLNRKKKRDSWFLDDYTFNPDSACSFNCLYCYIRGSKHGIHMEESLSAKVNAIELLDKQLTLRARKGDFGFIVVSSATDPYLKIEEQYELTRMSLQVILKHKFPVHVITKSDLVIRDFDLIHEIDRCGILPKDLEGVKHGALLTFSFSTLSDDISKVFEPGATPPSARLQTLSEAKLSGIYSGVSLMPLLPYISDTEESLKYYFETFSTIPVDFIFPATITLFGGGRADSKTLVMKAVKKHFPELLPKYEKLFQSNYLPHAYKNEVDRKTKLLCKQYGIRDHIN